MDDKEKQELEQAAREEAIAKQREDQLEYARAQYEELKNYTEE